MSVGSFVGANARGLGYRFAVARVFFFGEPPFEGERLLNRTDNFWEPATIHRGGRGDGGDGFHDAVPVRER